MLDFSKSYTIEPKLKKGDLQGLDKEGISKHLGTSMFLFAKYNPITNKFKTGLDVNSKDVLSITDKAKRQQKIDEIKSLKEELESYFGQPGILDPTSDFWDSFGITVTTGDNKQTYIELDGKVFDLNPSANPLHKLALIVLYANDYLPKSKSDSYNPKYLDDKFYLTTQEEVEKESEVTIKKEIRRGGELTKLFGDNPDEERAWQIAYYMGLKPNVGASSTKLQSDLYMATKDAAMLDVFLKACNLDNEDIVIANLFKQGVALDLIRYDGGIKLYTFGATNLRNTEDESILYLKTPQLATALAQLREGVNKRKNKIKKSI